MTPFEIAYRAAMPFLPPLNNLVRARLLSFAASFAPGKPDVLDIGGRKSPYTIGVPASVTITELPRVSEMRRRLNLGVDNDIIATVLSQRSNIGRFVYDDMTQSSLPDNSYDIVLAVEVLEHVEEDVAFIENVARVMKTNGLFLMSTPNGDENPIPHNPDHVRHYTKSRLGVLLGKYFDVVDIEYAVVKSWWRSKGLRRWSPYHPLETTLSIMGNVAANWQAKQAGVAKQAYGTGHLIASARNRA